MSKVKLTIILLVVLLFVGLCAFLLISNSQASTSDAFIETEKFAVNAQDSGKVKDVFVKPDENVTAGQLLAEIEVVETVSPAENKEDTIETFKTKLEEAEENHTNFAMMYKDGVISQQEYDESLEKLVSARNSYNNAKSKDNLKPVTTVVIKKVYAPADGVVAVSYIDKGEETVQNNPIVLLDTDNPKITAYFNPKYKEDLHVGADVLIKSDKYKGKVFEGVIEQIASEPEMHADKKSLVIPVTIKFKSHMSGYSFDKNQSLSVSLKR